MANPSARPSGRVPPFAKDAEIAVLGSILLNNESVEKVSTSIGPEDFYLDSHRRIFEAMVRLYKKQSVIDQITLSAELKEAGDFDRVGGVLAVISLTDSVATSVNVEHYAAIVRKKAAKRRVIAGAQEIVARGYKDSGDEDEFNEHIDKIALEALQMYRSQMPGSLLDLGDNVVKLYQKVAGGYRGVPMPWLTITNMTSGLWPQTMTIFVARPGVGKSQVAVLIGRHAWIEGYRVLIISPEMSKDEIAERFFVVEAQVSYRDLIAGTLADTEYPRLEEAVASAKSKSNLWIMDSSDDLTHKGIERAIRACQPDLVAIDSIYDLKVKGERRDRLLLSLEWMKSASKKYNFACVGFAQQNRVAELSDKKGGGSRLGTIALADEIGQDSHAVFALEQTKDMKSDKIMRIKPLKLRRGQYIRDSVDVNWDFDNMSFGERPRESEENYKDEADEIPF